MNKLRHIDSSLYWRNRANRPGQKSVMWRNEVFNNLFRQEQILLLNMLFKKNIDKPLEILEYGCGIGIFCKILTNVFPQAHITGVDFKEMITVAKQKNNHPRINYIESTAEEFADSNGTYDLIISSGCISAIMNREVYGTIFTNVKKLLKPSGQLLLIDPFHKFWPLARIPINTKEITYILSEHGLKLIYSSGISFWPIRLIIANSKYHQRTVTFLFRLGESLLRILGKKNWSDYKVLLFNHDRM